MNNQMNASVQVNPPLVGVTMNGLNESGKIGTPPGLKLTGSLSKSLGTVHLPVHNQALDRDP